jgi:hypothetical protein
MYLNPVDGYPYFENLLAFNKESKDTILFGEGWGDDKNPSNFSVNKINAIVTEGQKTIPEVLANPLLESIAKIASRFGNLIDILYIGLFI